MDGLIHKGCGGQVREDPLRAVYEYNAAELFEPPRMEKHPAMVCVQCGAEILGDAELEIWYQGVRVG